MAAIVNKLKKVLKQRQFKKRTIYGNGTKFDFMAGCYNDSNNPHNIKIGNECMIRGLLSTCENGTISIGNNTYIGGATRIGSANSIKIGNDVIIANDVHIYDNNNHPVTPKERLEMTQSSNFFGELWKWSNSENKPINIGDNVWIGERSAILKGVTIGKGAVVGCNSVVTHDVPEYTIVAGNPAKVVKTLSH